MMDVARKMDVTESARHQMFTSPEMDVNVAKVSLQYVTKSRAASACWTVAYPNMAGNPWLEHPIFLQRY